MALTDIAKWSFAKHITVHGEGRGIDPAEFVATKAGLARHEGTRPVGRWVAASKTRGISACGLTRARVRCRVESSEASSLQATGDGQSWTGSEAHDRASFPTSSYPFYQTILAFECGQVVNQIGGKHVGSVKVQQPA